MASQQPFVHDRSVVLHAPHQWWTSRTGEVVDGVDGIYSGDFRVVGGLALSVNGGVLEWVGNSANDEDASIQHHHHVIRTAGSGADPLVSLVRIRSLSGISASEGYAVVNASDAAISLVLEVRMDGEHTPMDTVKNGGVGISAPLGGRLCADGAETRMMGNHALLRWHLTIPARGDAEARWTFSLHSEGSMTAPKGDALVVPACPGRVGRLLRRSIADLNGLRMSDARTPAAQFFAAGSPWFFTLFGRDSLIAALLALPFSREVALGTLRTLAAYQGVRHDQLTGEQPGKILHEVRTAGFELDEGHRLPPVYYGSIDATMLWILLLERVLGSGLNADEASDLREPLEAATRWLLEYSDPDGDGLVEYIDESGHGLVNQGWKDSGDSIRFADGHLGKPPIALAEVQGYAYDAARAAVEVAVALHAEVDIPALRDFAHRVQEEFNARFWCVDNLGPYPALALDAAKNAVTGVASNMGYLVGSGLLSRQQETQVVARMMDSSLFSGFGVRTLSTTNHAYWPLRYHGGSVWSHDNGQIIWSFLRAGFVAEARMLANGLLDAAEEFEFRLPELFAGHARVQVPRALPYPASCRPQAWAAASGVVVWQALAGSADEIA